MSDKGMELVKRLHQEAMDRLRQQPSAEANTNHETGGINLPAAEPGSPVAAEWEMFRREVERLLRDGCRGKFALVTVGRPITVWDTARDAVQAAQMMYGEGPSVVQQILPYLRPLRVRDYRSCRA
jgi:hypothetical protein